MILKKKKIIKIEKKVFVSTLPMDLDLGGMVKNWLRKSRAVVKKAVLRKNGKEISMTVYYNPFGRKTRRR
jgi:hypothetical protein